MSTPSSSSIPPLGTAGFMTVPSTQNTAPVIKFRCLYTYDIRRKAKRWQDGFLRYHTFNKRIMVYDLTGNFIGDHHWRQEEGIQDGDELELDKGVLVQVCEGVEKTQTDLSALFEKRRSSQGSPQSNGFSTQTRRTTTTPMRPSTSSSSQIPRSLNDLLGIKKAPIGRTVSPKSPYEKRHPTVPAVNDDRNSERASKRQRVSPAKKSLHHENSQIVSSHDSPALVETPESNRHISSKKTPSMNPASRTLVESRKTPDPSKIRSNTPAVSNITTILDDTRLKDVQKQNDLATRNTVHSSSRPTPTARIPEEPRNTLRLSTSKPRRKLMYSALLPGQGQGSSSSATTATTTTTAAAAANSKANHNNNNGTNTDIMTCPDNVATTPRSLQPHVSEQKSADACLFHYDDEPLDSPMLEDIFTELQSKPPPVASGKKPSVPVTTVPSTTVKTGHGFSSTDHFRSTKDWTASSRQLPPTTTNDRGSTSGNKSDTNNHLTHHARLNNNDNKHDAVVPGKKSLKSCPPCPSFSTLPPRPQVSVTVNDKNNNNDNTTRSKSIIPQARQETLQKSLRKSFSDPSSLNPRESDCLSSRPSLSNSNPSDSTTATAAASGGERDETKEQGPWTSEALDLFDFWPPGRQKPC